MIPTRLDRFVALDVEIAGRSPLTVCAIAVARFEAGMEIGHDSSLVHVPGRVRYTDVHGLTRADLSDAPPWTVVWQRLVVMFDGIQAVVAYRAAFDRAAVMTMCARHSLRMPRVRFVCAAAMYQDRFGHSVPLDAALRHVDLPFPGRPHDPLADARAAAALALRLRAIQEEGGAIQLSQSPFQSSEKPMAGDPAISR